jgi:hypothetical protein
MHRAGFAPAGRGNLVIAIVAFVVGVGLVLAGRAAAVDSHFQSGSVGVEFTDPLGRATREPVMTITGAAPAMSPAHGFVRVRNTGTLAARYTVSTTNLLPEGDPSPAQVLVVAVSDTAGRSLYSGSLSGLSVSEDRLEPGQTRSYELRITWPPTPEDNAYQGRSFAFSLQAAAVPSAT